MCALLLCIGSVPAFAAKNKPETPPRDLPALKNRIQKLLDKHHIPGAGIALFDHSGVTWAGGVGMANVADSQSVTGDTLFRIGSVSKTFIVLSLLQLEEEGHLKLDDRIHALLPEVPLQNRWRKTDPITVAQVLEHTAGFDDMHFRDIYVTNEAGIDMPLLKVLRRERSSLVARWQPGSRMSYSNDGYLLAGYLLEKLAGEPYERYIEQHLFTPLGMSHAIIAQGRVPPGLAQGYTGKREKVVPLHWIYTRPAGAVMASPRELAHVGVMLLDQGRWHGQQIIEPRDVIRMRTPQTSAAARHGLALGYGLATFGYNTDGALFYGHDGGIGGFISRYAYSPELGKGFVLLVNTDTPGKGMNEAAKAIVSYLKQGATLLPPPKVIHEKPTALAAIEGFYRRDNPRNQIMAPVSYLIDVFRLQAGKDGSLSLHALTQKPKTLLPVGHNLWRRPDDATATIVNFRGPDGRMTIDTGFLQAKKVTAVSAYGPLALVVLALLLMASTILFAPIWLIRLAMGRLRGVGHWSVRLLPLGTTLALAGTAFAVTRLDLPHTGTANLYTISLFAGSLLFAGLSLWTLVQAVRAYQWPINRWLRLHSLLVALACSGLTAFFLAYGWIGMRLWAY